MELNHSQELQRLHLRTQQLETVRRLVACLLAVLLAQTPCLQPAHFSCSFSSPSLFCPPKTQELSVAQQRLLELHTQVDLLNVAAAAKGIDLHTILTTAAAAQGSLAAAAQQQLLAAAAATASKGLELQTMLAAAAAQQAQVAATAQQQLLAAAAAAACPPAPLPHAAPPAAASSLLLHGDGVHAEWYNGSQHQGARAGRSRSPSRGAGGSRDAGL